MSKLMQELENKITAIETLEHMMKTCGFRIVSCDCTGNIDISWDDKGYFVVGDERGFPNIESAIKKFAELTEH
jgi:hypothetical protein